ncbi:response regulator [Candidatus Parcubacteria bacterium]|nr:response regulator [Candidatus Parcubacteria bacterium]
MEEDSNTKKMMIVDDDSFLLDMYSTKFKASGYEVITALTPDICIEKIENGFNPDILIFDLIMPKMNGVELFKFLKEKNLVNSSVNVVLTNQGKATDYDKVKDLGIDGYIVKALHTPSEVLQKIEEIYNKKQQ